jgi:uncharacterized membrane protein (DUF485 family)
MSNLVNLHYDCQQPVFYLGSALTSLSAVAVFLVKLQKEGKISMTHLLVMLTLYAVVIYVISRLINWLCTHQHREAAWVVALLPILGVLMTVY